MKKTWQALWLFLVSSSVAWSLGLGPIHLHSALDEPLNADVDLIVRSPQEIENITIALASEEEYARRGLERPFFLDDLRLTLSQRPDGTPYIHITSRKPIHEPFIDLLLEIDGPQGRLLRRYTLLLDPRETPARPVAPEKPQQGQMAETLETQTPATYGPVRRGETLWTIAQRLRPDPSITPQQMMLALLKENPDAFLEGNINKLKAGAVLKVPDRETVLSISTKEAVREIQQHNAALEKKPAAAKGQLRLVTPGKGTPPPKDEIALLKEEISSKEKENQHLKGKVQELEAMVASMQRLIALKDRELAKLKAHISALEKQLQEAPAAPTQPKSPQSQPKAEVGKADAQPPEPNSAPVQKTALEQKQAGKALWLQLSSLTLAFSALLLLMLLVAWWFYRQRRASAMATPIFPETFSESSPAFEGLGEAPQPPPGEKSPGPTKETETPPETPRASLKEEQPEVKAEGAPVWEPLEVKEEKAEEPAPDLQWEPLEKEGEKGEKPAWTPPEEKVEKAEPAPDLQWEPLEEKGEKGEKPAWTPPEEKEEKAEEPAPDLQWEPLEEKGEKGEKPAWT
ncbi:MAG: hypothetical protein D6819_03640, partial [Gammaproteobacteria bacterium]